MGGAEWCIKPTGWDWCGNEGAHAGGRHYALLHGPQRREALASSARPGAYTVHRSAPDQRDEHFLQRKLVADAVAGPQSKGDECIGVAARHLLLIQEPLRPGTEMGRGREQQADITGWAMGRMQQRAATARDAAAWAAESPWLRPTTVVT